MFRTQCYNLLLSLTMCLRQKVSLTSQGTNFIPVVKGMGIVPILAASTNKRHVGLEPKALCFGIRLSAR